MTNGWNPNTIILAITALVTALTPILLALINHKAGKQLENTEIAKNSAIATAESVEKVHVAVNSERTKMIEEIRTLREELRSNAATMATLIEQARVPKGP